MQTMPTIIIKAQEYLDHDPGAGHPESPRRLSAIYDRISQPDVSALYRTEHPREATVEELCWNHTRPYVERIERTAGVPHFQLDPDTSTSAGSWQAAILAVGGVFTAMDTISSGNAQSGFALVRPPGHHAERDQAMGFCLFNNVALGAYYARKVLGMKRVLIVDWDLHHGNGTQHSFYDSSDVLYFSTHQYPHYPGSGAADQTGEGNGKGFTVNVPLAPGAGDMEYAAIFNHILAPIAAEFSPDFIIVSAGFDIYYQDPLGGMLVTERGFAWLARKLMAIAGQCCDHRILFCLEGGYNLTGLSEGVTAVIKECAYKSILAQKETERFSRAHELPETAREAMEIQSRFWKGLANVKDTI